MPDISEHDALNVKESMGSPLSDEERAKQRRYKIADKVAGADAKPNGLLNKQLPNLKIFGGT